MHSKIQIYTDGSCLNNPGNGGWAFLILLNEKEYFSLNGGERNTTNNRMELEAVIKSFEYLKENSFKDAMIDVFLDSNYVKEGITNWTKNWVKNNWKTSNNKAVLNKDLWLKLLELSSFYKTINWHWVKAHNGDVYNEKVDSLARSFAMSLN